LVEAEQYGNENSLEGEAMKYEESLIKQQGGKINLKDNEIAFLSEIKNIPISSNGMYEYKKQEVIVPTNGAITMKNIPHKIKGKSLETGETKIMIPGMEYFFKNTQNVLEKPLK